MPEFLLGLLAGLPIWGGLTLWAVHRLESQPAVEPKPEPELCFVFGCTSPGHAHPRVTG